MRTSSRSVRRSLVGCAAVCFGVIAVVVLGESPNTTDAPSITSSGTGVVASTQPSVAQQKLACAQRAMVFLQTKTTTGGEASVVDVALWSGRLLQAEIDVATTHDEKLAAMHKYCEGMKVLEAEADRRSKRGLISPLQRESLTYQRLEVEQRMAVDR